MGLHCPLPSGRWRVTLALVVASLLWGSLYPAAKPAIAATGPMQVTFCRVLLAFVALALLIFVRSGPGLLAQQLREHWRAVLVLGIFNFAVSQILAMSAQSLLPASVNGLLNNTHPLWVASASSTECAPRGHDCGRAVNSAGVPRLESGPGLAYRCPPLVGQVVQQYVVAQ